jgi:hypothetical protein
MQKVFIFALAALFSTGAMAGAEHYVRVDGGHVQHLKITKQKGDVDVLVDVDFDPQGSETDKPCSFQIAGEAKVLQDGELVLRKQAQGEAHYCQLNIKVNGDQATIEESTDCARYFTGGFCRFGSEGKALTRVK